MTSPTRALRQVEDRWLLVVVTLLWGCILVGYTVLTPVWRSPDEVNHFDLVLDVSGGRGYAAWDDDELSVGVIEASSPVRDRPPRVPFAGDLPPLPVVSDDDAMSELANHMTQHPPAYYELMGAELSVMRAVGLAPESLSGQLALVRVLSALFLVPLPALGWLLARRLGASPGVSRIALLLPLAVPGLAQVGSGVTNDAPLPLLFACVGLALASMQRAASPRRAAAVTGVLCGLALFTKAFGAAALLWALLVVAAGLRRRGGRETIVTSAILGGSAFLTGGWWYGRNLVLDGRVLPSLEEGRFDAPSSFASAHRDLGDWASRFWPTAGRGFFGLFGYAEVAVSDLAYRIALVVALAGVVAGAVAVWRRGRTALVLLVAPLPILLVLQVSQSYRLFEQSGLVALAHGRYLLPAFVPCAVLVSFAFTLPRRPLSRGLGLVVVALGVLLHAHVLTRLVDFFWSDDGTSEALRTAVEWSPLMRPVSVAALGSVVPLLGVLIVLVVWLPGDRGPAGGGRPRTPPRAPSTGSPTPSGPPASSSPRPDLAG